MLCYASGAWPPDVGCDASSSTGIQMHCASQLEWCLQKLVPVA